MATCPGTPALRLLARPYLAETLGRLLDARGAPVRFGELRRTIPTTAHTLAARLRDLADAGLATRIDHHESPPRVEYRATTRAETLRPLLASLTALGPEPPEPSYRAPGLARSQ